MWGHRLVVKRAYPPHSTALLTRSKGLKSEPLPVMSYGKCSTVGLNQISKCDAFIPLLYLVCRGELSGIEVNVKPLHPTVLYEYEFMFCYVFVREYREDMLQVDMHLTRDSRGHAFDSVGKFDGLIIKEGPSNNSCYMIVKPYSEGGFEGGRFSKLEHISSVQSSPPIQNSFVGSVIPDSIMMVEDEDSSQPCWQGTGFANASKDEMVDSMVNATRMDEQCNQALVGEVARPEEEHSGTL